MILIKNMSETEAVQARLPAKKRDKGQLLLTEEIVETNRNPHEKAKVITRDGCCIIIHTMSPDICHVFSYSAKAAPDQTQTALNALSIL